MKAILCGLLFWASGQICQAQNFVNGSFEAWGTAACDVNTPPDSWANYSNGGIGADEARFPGCPSTIPNAAQSGAAYARFYAASLTTGEGHSQMVSGFAIGTAYQVRYYYCGSNLYGGTANNQVHLFMNGIDVHQSPVFASTLSTWTLATYNFTATAATYDFGFRMYAPSGAGTGSGALDNLSIGVALPAEQLSFYAVPEPEGRVNLSWQTATEVDLDHFTIERMIEGGHWEDVGELPAVGNSQIPQHYEAYDRTEFLGKCYYRLRQTDKNGGYAVSPVVAIQVGGDLEFSLSPNPADQQIQVLGLAAEPTSMTVLDAMGKEFPCPTDATSEALTLLTSHLQPGVYFLSMQVNGVRVTKRFLVVRE